MTMLLYHLLAERLRDWRAQRKAAREINALLRGCGFVETAPRDWRKTMVLPAPVCSGDGPVRPGIRQLAKQAPRPFRASRIDVQCGNVNDGV
jgi:hypothetical protein